MKEINIEKFDKDDFIEGENEKWPFTQISNYVVQNIGDALSGFLWVYLQTLPPTWVINKHHLKSHFNIGEHSYKKAMAYLKKCNLISQYQEKAQGGLYGRSRVIVKNGSKFIHPKDHDNKAMQLNPPINMEVLNDLPTSTESKLVAEKDNSPVVENRLTEPTVSRKSTSYIKKIYSKKKTKNKKTTTTPSEQPIPSSSFICIDELEEYGFTNKQAKQMLKSCDSVEEINSSILNYKEALQDKMFFSGINNKVAYLMGILKEFGKFGPRGKKILTPAEQKRRYLIENNVDDRYGI